MLEANQLFIINYSVTTSFKFTTSLQQHYSSIIISILINIAAAGAVDRELLYIGLGDLFPLKATTAATATTQQQQQQQQQQTKTTINNNNKNFARIQASCQVLNMPLLPCRSPATPLHIINIGRARAARARAGTRARARDGSEAAGIEKSTVFN